MADNRPAQLYKQVDILLRGRLIYLSTVRQDNTQSAAAPLWYTTTSEGEILIQSRPNSWQTRRVRRGSPVIVSFGRWRGGACIGEAHLTNDPRVIEQIVRDYRRKYLMAWFGLHRPTTSSFERGDRVAMRITLVKALPRDFRPRAGFPAPEYSPRPAPVY